MIKSERQDYILKRLTEQKYCKVQALAQELYVAPITIRRDLEELEAAGLIRRCHGGAGLPDHPNREVPFALREREHSSAKAQLAAKAAAMLKNGDTVFIDASTTLCHITDYIQPEQNLTIITNSLRIPERLNGRQIRCYLLGGMPVDNSHALVGKLAEDALSSLYADVCFFSSQGIDENGIISDYSEDQTRLRRLMIHHAKRSIFVYDRSKRGKQFLFKLCHIDELDGVITDSEK